MSATDESVAAALARLELPPELVATVAHER